MISRVHWLAEVDGYTLVAQFKQTGRPESHAADKACLRTVFCLVRVAVPTQASIRRAACVVKTAVAGLLIVLVMLSATLASSSWHRHSHDFNRAADEHHCLLCLFARGQVLAEDPPPLFSLVPAASVRLDSLSESPLPGRIDRLLAPSRAPPVFFS